VATPQRIRPAVQGGFVESASAGGLCLFYSIFSEEMSSFLKVEYRIEQVLTRSIDHQDVGPGLLSRLKVALQEHVVDMVDLADACCLTGDPLLDVLESATLVHRDARKVASENSRRILQSQLTSEMTLEPKDSISAEIRETQRELTNFVYGIFAVFGTGIAVFLALHMFASHQLGLELEVIGALLAASTVTVAELVYYIKLFYYDNTTSKAKAIKND
jgi:hypothetical protein